MPNISTSITQLRCRTAQSLEAKEFIVWDTNLRGFGLRVSPRGKKVSSANTGSEAPGAPPWKERQITLGTLAVLTVADARDRARPYKARAPKVLIRSRNYKAAEQAEETPVPLTP